MNAHLLDANGVILNTIIVDSLSTLPGLVDASIGGQIGDRIVNGALLPAAPKPIILAPLSPRQFRQALNKFGFRQQVEAAITASGDQDLKDWYEFTSEFQRAHPEVLTMAAALGFSAAQLDQLWIYGATI